MVIDHSSDREERPVSDENRRAGIAASDLGRQELRAALEAQGTQFVNTVTGKLLTYALGRGLEYYDAPTVRAIDRSAAANDYRWSSVILGIVKSPEFQMSTDQTRTSRQVISARNRGQ